MVKKMNTKKKKDKEKIVIRRHMHTIMNWVNEHNLKLPPYVSGALFGLYERALLKKGMLDVIDRVGNSDDENYESLGMGSLDYHEKCAVDGLKEYLKANLK